MRVRYVEAVIGALLGTGAMACSYPAPPAAMPDGSTASKEEMMAKKREVDRYKLQVYTYIECATDQRRKTWARVDLEDVTRRFNKSVRAFKLAGNED